jgi:membrane-bound hydrogenase subunit mbhJ
MKLTKHFDKSLWVFHVNAASCNGCDIEIVAALTPRYDVERFGIKLVGTPRHADVLLVTGPVNTQIADRVRRIYEQTPGPKAVLLCGNCGASSGVYYDSYCIQGPFDEFIKKVDPNAIVVYVPGCPVRPEAITMGVVEAWKALEKLRGEA